MVGSGKEMTFELFHPDVRNSQLSHCSVCLVILAAIACVY